MDAAHTIRDAIARVAALRTQAQNSPALGEALRAVKQLQAQRFAGTYTDLLDQGPYGAATQFFLSELYGAHDFAERDAQFARIADALQTLFPKQVVATATTLAQLHVLTEELDCALARAWMEQPLEFDTPQALRYVRAWRQMAASAQRARQLQMVVQTGKELERLTRLPGLRLMLKLMRKPALASGLGNLQRFLESGFDTFADLAQQPDGVATFLAWVQQRETGWMDWFDGADEDACASRLAACLAQGTSPYSG
jgi:hypothetical protein